MVTIEPLSHLARIALQGVPPEMRMGELCRLRNQGIAIPDSDLAAVSRNNQTRLDREKARARLPVESIVSRSRETRKDKIAGWAEDRLTGYVQAMSIRPMVDPALWPMCYLVLGYYRYLLQDATERQVYTQSVATALHRHKRTIQRCNAALARRGYIIKSVDDETGVVTIRLTHKSMPPRENVVPKKPKRDPHSRKWREIEGKEGYVSRQQTLHRHYAE
jgi:hypothetical protein